MKYNSFVIPIYNCIFQLVNIIQIIRNDFFPLMSTYFITDHSIINTTPSMKTKMMNNFYVFIHLFKSVRVLIFY